jgi:hypothetical protein
MRRFTAGLLASGGVLFLSGAAGLMASWSVVAGVLFLAAGGVTLAIVMEDEDLRTMSRSSAAPEPPAFDPAA